MTQYWLITEPARGTSVRVDVPAGTDPDDALRAYAQRWFPATLAEWRDEGEPDDLATYLTDALGDEFRLIDETARY